MKKKSQAVMIWHFLSALISRVLTLACNGQGLAMGWNSAPSAETKVKLKNKKLMKIENADKCSSAGTTAEQSTNADVTSVCQPIAKPDVVRSFLSVQELRIGNCVNGVYGNCFVHSIAMLGGEYVLSYLNSQFNSKYDGLVNLKDCQPIPLSENILKDAGFEYIKEVGGYCDKNHVIYKFKSGYWGFNMFCAKDRDCTISIKYLHQLQNLCFSLTGSELEVSLK